ncbi:TSUP family transporter [Pseudooceanicola sp.]|uniref:TSUP family transporter n=1 Tax=Pseudooceanicola sp. TaxID=1914328 RepID=UPI0026236CC2|nr:TSUP family transporter [Pseudooceanicola sp.]MDF1856876.1 TSUP family transporter [Pseudooceanicola sp.]
MPEGLATALDTPGLLWLLIAYLIAGLVRGFTGFGTALIVMPLAGALLPLPMAIVLLSVTGVFTWPAMLPGAWRYADHRQVALMAGAAIVAAPFGVWLLTFLSRDMLRWLVSGAAAVTLAALISGWRYRGRVRGPGLGAIGAAAGVLGGATGLTGPPVILFYLAGPSNARAVRANTILFLAALEIGIIANLFLRGLVGVEALWLGLVLAVPYVLAVLVGQRLFDPAREKTFRALAYSVIGIAILVGLPILD